MIENSRRHYSLIDVPAPFGKPAKKHQSPEDNGDFMFLLLLVMLFFDDESFFMDENFMTQLMEIFYHVPENNPE